MQSEKLQGRSLDASSTDLGEGQSDCTRVGLVTTVVTGIGSEARRI